MHGIRTIGRLFRQVGFGTHDERDSEYPYRCQGCETTYDVQYHVCPDCGSFSVERCHPWSDAEPDLPVQ